MRKIDYSKIRWNASTNWEFCGSKENLKEMWNRYAEHCGVRFPIEEFGYSAPVPGLAYEKGDIVTYTESGHPVLALVVEPVNGTGYFSIRTPDGHVSMVCPKNIASHVSIADMPEELIMLARIEANKPLDFSKCPLKDPGVCMKN